MSSPHQSSENLTSQSSQSGKMRLGLMISGIAGLSLILAIGWRFSNANAVRSPASVSRETLPEYLIDEDLIDEYLTKTPFIQPSLSQTSTFKLPEPIQPQAVMGNIRSQSRSLPQNSEQLTTIPKSPTPETSRNRVQNPVNIPQERSPISDNKTDKIIPATKTISPLNLRAKITTEKLEEKLEEKFEIVPVQSEPEVELEPKQPASEIPGIELRLPDTIYLALENNRTIKNQYLERIVQRQDLIVEEDKFVPDFTPRIALDWDNIEQGGTSNTTSGGLLSARLEMIIPTGGEFDLGWEGRRENRSGEGLSGDDRNIFRQNLELSFRQPLLRGAGIDLNRASIKIARIQETINLLDLKLTLIDEITDAILAYRRLLQAQERLKIEQNSLEIAQQQVENTQVLIEAGRQARVDLVPVRTRVANQEISVLNAEGNLQEQQLALLEILDLEGNFDIIAIDQVESVEPRSLDFEAIKQLTLENRPDYLRAKLEVEQSQFELQIAENERRWNIDINTEARRELAPDIIEDRTEVRAGIELTKRLGDRTIERDFKRRQVDLSQAKNDLDEEFQQLEIELRNRIRDVNNNLERVQLAQRATQLAEEQFRNEEEKIRLGAGNSSINDLVRFQEDLVEARNDELNAKIEYLNSITELNQAVGTTLETWDITLERNVEIDADEN
ncbi:MAG: TolC family protein [Cyanobacteriota bacterium]|nr:TolC family protein [Cyanobacteriota bacterium]